MGEPCDLVDVDELAPDMCHAGDFTDGPGAVEVFEPGIAVGMHPATVAGEMIFGMLALAVAGEAIPGGGRGQPAPGAFIAGIGPEPCGLGLAGARRQHANWRVIGKDRFAGQDVPPDGIGQGLQQGGGFANPVGQCRAVDVEPVAVKDLALAVKRKVIGVFVDQHMGKKAWTRTPALDGARWQRSLREAIAA